MELELGMALGLFAIFSILRYRTDAMKVHDMTYLFVLVGIAVVNALSNKKTSYTELLFTNMVIFLACLLLEKYLAIGKLKTCMLQTDRIDLIAADKQAELRQFVVQQTGLNVKSVQVEKVDLKNGKVQMTVFHNGTHS